MWKKLILWFQSSFLKYVHHAIRIVKIKTGYLFAKLTLSIYVSVCYSADCLNVIYCFLLDYFDYHKSWSIWNLSQILPSFFCQDSTYLVGILVIENDRFISHFILERVAFELVLTRLLSNSYSAQDDWHTTRSEISKISILILMNRCKYILNQFLTDEHDSGLFLWLAPSRGPTFILDCIKGC